METGTSTAAPPLDELLKQIDEFKECVEAPAKDHAKMMKFFAITTGIMAYASEETFPIPTEVFDRIGEPLRRVALLSVCCQVMKSFQEEGE